MSLIVDRLVVASRFRTVVTPSKQTDRHYLLLVRYLICQLTQSDTSLSTTLNTRIDSVQALLTTQINNKVCAKTMS